MFMCTHAQKQQIITEHCTYHTSSIYKARLSFTYLISLWSNLNQGIVKGRIQMSVS